jgi:hypothetical protein
MVLEYNSLTSKFIYEGCEVGEYIYENGKARVRIDITYECDAEFWFEPLSWFATGLSYLPQHQPKNLELAALIIKTGKDSIARKYKVLRNLYEVRVKRGGNVWDFYKNDKDEWPSALHGHDYEKHLILDAITGKIFDRDTKQHCEDLKAKTLSFVQKKLRNSKDFKQKVTRLIDSKN